MRLVPGRLQREKMETRAVKTSISLPPNSSAGNGCRNPAREHGIKNFVDALGELRILDRELYVDLYAPSDKGA
jgi:hypothetical protein